MEDDRAPEGDDYFEFADIEVTATGLGEAARRTKAKETCAAYSFEGGTLNFENDPLAVDHGLKEERLGRYDVTNLWRIDRFEAHALAALPPITSWSSMIEYAQARFRHLEIGPLHENRALSREPFEASIRDRSIELLTLLDQYVQGRQSDGSEGSNSRWVIDNYFKGERALFTGESASNERAFRREMTFTNLAGGETFAPWHGKISHRFFRMHFEWPLPPEKPKLEILYLGPKLTKS